MKSDQYVTSLCACCSGCLSANKWFPRRRIEEWREYISQNIYGLPITEMKNNNHYAIVSNIAYNLQYLEYLNQNIKRTVFVASTFGTNV